MDKESSTSPWNLPELLARVDNDQELLCELLAIFQEDFPRTMNSLESALTNHDLQNAATVSHSLKGMLSNLAGTRAAAAAARIEQLSKDGTKEGLAAAWRDLRNETNLLAPEVDAYLKEVRR